MGKTGGEDSAFVEGAVVKGSVINLDLYMKASEYSESNAMSLIQMYTDVDEKDANDIAQILRFIVLEKARSAGDDGVVGRIESIMVMQEL